MVAAPPVPTIDPPDPPGPQGPAPAHDGMMIPRSAAVMTTKNVRAAPRVVPMKSAQHDADRPAMTAAVRTAHPALPRVSEAAKGPRVADPPIVRRLPGLAHHAEVMTALAIACVEPSERMTANDQPVHPIGAKQGLTSVGESAANAPMTAAAMVIGLRAHLTAVPTGVPTGPIRANPVLISVGTMTGPGAVVETGPIGVDLSATTPPIGADKASDGRQNESRKPNPIMCASTVSSPMPAFAAAVRPTTSLWPAL